MSSTNPCRTCKSYKKCSRLDEDFSYSDIRWCPYQVLWLLENEGRLRTSGWITEDDNRGSPNIPHAASFENIINVLAELDMRLACTKTHGKKLREQAIEGRTIISLSKQARAALMYVKGWRRKRISYARWLREVYFRHPKNSETVAKPEPTPENQS